MPYPDGTLRRAVPSDRGGIDAFLARYAATSMFLRSNLAACGIDAAHGQVATDFIVSQSGGEIDAVFGLTRGGYLLAQMPHGCRDLDRLRAIWAGRRVLGMTGAPAQVDAVLAALHLNDAPRGLDQDQPLYALDLAAMTAPSITVRAPCDPDRALLNDWFHAYGRDTGLPFSQAEVQDRVDRAMAGDRVCLLEDSGQAVAMSAFNAEVADMVQIGGVFVPPALRRRGHGRHVVAGQLQQARARGIARAILFAANTAAARAYEAIGFVRIGTFRVTMFDPEPTL